jgi:nucleotide-binding universal stress UspA family protein
VETTALGDDRAMEDAPVLICYDGTEESEHAIDAAAALFGPGQAVVLDVGPPETVGESLAPVSSIVPVPESSFADLNTSEALGRARLGAARAESAGFAAEPRAALATPTWQGIVDVADEIDAAVIVLGSRGLTGVREHLRGSVSHEVAEHAGRPVLIVPPPHGRR